MGIKAKYMLRQEMDIAYNRWIHRPGSYLGVLDNAGDYEVCKERVHCNATHGGIAPSVVYNETKKLYELDESNMQDQYTAFNSIPSGRRHTIVHGAEHNYVYFPENILSHVRQTADGLIIFLCNMGSVPYAGEVTVKGRWQGEIGNAINAQVETIKPVYRDNQTVVNIFIKAYNSVLVILNGSTALPQQP